MLRRGFLKLLGAGCGITLIAIGTIAIRSSWNNRDGRCIYSRPVEFVRGRMRLREGGIFGAGVMVYELAYRGTHERSGAYCKRWFYVTEGEYERRMYSDRKSDDE